MLIKWKEKYLTGIDEIDGHHKKLFQLLNQSYFLLLQDDKREELSQLLDELIDYTKYHFLAEEDLMRNNKYEYIDQHIIEHFSFINKVFSLKKELVDGNEYLSVDVFDFIRSWLLNHILEVDSKMAKIILRKQSV